MRLEITAYKDGEVLGSGSYSRKRIPRVKIGSAEDMHLRVEEPGIADEHTEIYIQEGKAYARPLGEATVWLNGAEIEGESELAKDDRLKICDGIEFTVSVSSKRKEIRKPSPEEPESRPEPSGGRISFKKFSAEATEQDDEFTYQKLEPTPPEPEPKAPAPRARRLQLRRPSKLDVIKIVAILIMVIVLFGMVILPTILKLMVA